MKARILVVEDEADIADVVRHHLVREGYKVTVVRDGREALRRVAAEVPDLVILDLMLPGLDGVEVCRRIKADPSTRAIPVIMVTAKTGEADIVLGLGVGADDYVPKPFSPRALVARVGAVLRRGPLKDEADPDLPIARGPLAIDPRRHEARLDGALLDLTATEFRLLRALAAEPGRVFSREEILRRVAGGDAVVEERTIDAHVAGLRRKLGRRRRLVETVRGVGYRFAEAEEA